MEQYLTAMVMDESSGKPMPKVMAIMETGTQSNTTYTEVIGRHSMGTALPSISFSEVDGVCISKIIIIDVGPFKGDIPFTVEYKGMKIYEVGTRGDGHRIEIDIGKLKIDSLLTISTMAANLEIMIIGGKL